MLAYEDAAAAIDWLERAFGFRERPNSRYTDEQGTVGHAELELGDGVIMVSSPTPEYRDPRLDLGMDALLRLLELPAIAFRAHGQDLGQDRECRLLLRVRADVEPARAGDPLQRLL
jgi:hypothetical protein